MNEHLLSRGYDLCLYPTQWVTDTTLSVPLFSLEGKLKGIQTYTRGAPKKTKDPSKARYYTRSFDGQHLWGTELELNSNVIFLTESVFKASSLHLLGYNAWTTLNATLSQALKDQLLALPYRFICWGDNDKAGKQFSKSMSEGLVSEDIDELDILTLITLAEAAINGNNL